MTTILALSLVELSGWIVWLLVATLAGVGSLWLLTEGRRMFWPGTMAPEMDEVVEDIRFCWAAALICLIWWGLLALFLFKDWEKLDLVVVAPVSALFAGWYGTWLGEVIGWRLVGRRYQKALDRVWGNRQKRDPVPYRGLKIRLDRICEEEGIPFDLAKLNEYRKLDAEDVKSLLQCCYRDAGPTGSRDATVIVLLYGCGLSRNEIVSSSIDRFGTEMGEVTVWYDQTWLKNTPRRDKRQVRPCRPMAVMAQPFSYWAADRGDDPGPYICHVTSEGEVVPSRPITASKIYHILKIRGEEVGIPAFQNDSLKSIGLTTEWPGSIVPREKPLPPVDIKFPGRDWTTLGSTDPYSGGDYFAEASGLGESFLLGYIAIED